MGPVAVLSILIYRLCRKRENIILKIIAEILFPVTIGLAIVTLLLVVFNSWQEGVSDGKVRLVENSVFDIYDFVKGIKGFVGTISIIIIAALFFIDYYYKNARAAIRFKYANTLLSRVFIILFTICSFTFFSSDPPGITTSDYQKRTVRYRDTLEKQEKQYRANYIAAERLREDIRNLSPVSKNYYRGLFQKINVRGEALADQVAVNVADKIFESDNPGYITNNTPIAAIANNDPQISKTFPVSRAQRDYEDKLIRRQEAEVEVAKSLMDHTIEKLREACLKSIWPESGELGDAFGGYLDELINKTGELIVKKAGNLLNDRDIKKIEIYSKQIMARITDLPLLSRTEIGNKEFTATEIDDMVGQAVTEEYQKETVKEEAAKVKEQERNREREMVHH